MKSSKILQIALIIIVAFIWTGVFYKMFSLKKKEDNVISKEKTVSSMDQGFINRLLNELKIDFTKENIIDPFCAFATDKKAYKQPEKPKTVPITSPAYLLQGIAWDEADPRAILIKSKIYKEPGNMKIGETIIVEKNNSIDYGKVLNITEDYVLITTYNKKFKLRNDLWEKIE